MARRRAKDPLLAKLRAGIEAVLSDASSTPAEKLKAVEAGVRLLMMQHKTTDQNDSGFFG